MTMALYEKNRIMHHLHKLFAEYPGLGVKAISKLANMSVNKTRHWTMKLEDEGYLRHDTIPANRGSVIQHRYYVTERPLPPCVGRPDKKRKERIKRAEKSTSVPTVIRRDPLIAAFFGPARSEVAA